MQDCGQVKKETKRRQTMWLIFCPNWTTFGTNYSTEIAIFKANDDNVIQVSSTSLPSKDCSDYSFPAAIVLKTS